MPVRKVRRVRGRGPIGSAIGGVLGGMLGFGRKRRVRRGGMTLDQAWANSRPIKPAVITPADLAAWNVGRVGMARRRKVRRGGFTVPDWLKPTLTKIKEVALEKGADWVGRKTGNTSLSRSLQRFGYDFAKKYGFGRKKKRVRGGRVYNRLLL